MGGNLSILLKKTVVGILDSNLTSNCFRTNDIFPTLELCFTEKENMFNQIKFLIVPRVNYNS